MYKQLTEPQRYEIYLGLKKNGAKTTQSKASMVINL